MADESDIQEIQSLREHLKEADAKQKQAKKRINDTSDQTKTIENLNEPEVIERKKTEALHEIEVAKAEIGRADAEINESAKRLRDEKLKNVQDAGPTIAGYKPLELIKAIAVPPLPHDAVTAVPKALRKEVENKTADVKSHIKQTKRELNDVEKSIKSIHSDETENKPEPKHTGDMSQAFRKFLVSQNSPVSFKAFMTAGIVFLLVGTFLAILTSPFVGLAIVFIGIAELCMGILMKKMA